TRDFVRSSASLGEQRARLLDVLIGDALAAQLLLQPAPAGGPPPPAAREPGARELSVVHEFQLDEPCDHGRDRRTGVALVLQPPFEVHARSARPLEQLERGLAAGVGVGGLLALDATRPGLSFARGP